MVSSSLSERLYHRMVRLFMRSTGNAEEIRYKSQNICVAHDRSVDVARTVDREFEVAEVEDGGDELTRLRNVPL